MPRESRAAQVNVGAKPSRTAQQVKSIQIDPLEDVILKRKKDLQQQQENNKTQEMKPSKTSGLLVKKLLKSKTKDNSQANSSSKSDKEAAELATKLHWAADKGEFALVGALLRSGANVNARESQFGNTALHQAAWRGFSYTVEVLCKYGADTSIRNEFHQTPLHFACRQGHNRSARVLLAAGAKHHVKDKKGDTPLHLSVRCGHAGTAKILLAARCDINSVNKNMDTPLHLAVAAEDPRLVRELMLYGAEKVAKNMQNLTAMDIALQRDLIDIQELIMFTPAAKQSSGSHEDDDDDDCDDDRCNDACCIMERRRHSHHHRRHRRSSRHRGDHHGSRTLTLADDTRRQSRYAQLSRLEKVYGLHYGSIHVNEPATGEKGVQLPENGHVSANQRELDAFLRRESQLKLKLKKQASTGNLVQSTGGQAPESYKMLLSASSLTLQHHSNQQKVPSQTKRLRNKTIDCAQLDAQPAVEQTSTSQPPKQDPVRMSKAKIRSRHGSFISTSSARQLRRTPAQLLIKSRKKNGSALVTQGTKLRLGSLHKTLTAEEEDREVSNQIGEHSAAIGENESENNQSLEPTINGANKGGRRLEREQQQLATISEQQVKLAPNGAKLLRAHPMAPLDDMEQLYATPRKAGKANQQEVLAASEAKQTSGIASKDTGGGLLIASKQQADSASNGLYATVGAKKDKAGDKKCESTETAVPSNGSPCHDESSTWTDVVGDEERALFECTKGRTDQTPECRCHSEKSVSIQRDRRVPVSMTKKLLRFFGLKSREANQASETSISQPEETPSEAAHPGEQVLAAAKSPMDRLEIRNPDLEQEEEPQTAALSPANCSTSALGSADERELIGARKPLECVDADVLASKRRLAQLAMDKVQRIRGERTSESERANRNGSQHNQQQISPYGAIKEYMTSIHIRGGSGSDGIGMSDSSPSNMGADHFGSSANACSGYMNSTTADNTSEDIHQRGGSSIDSSIGLSMNNHHRLREAQAMVISKLASGANEDKVTATNPAGYVKLTSQSQGSNGFSSSTPSPGSSSDNHSSSQASTSTNSCVSSGSTGGVQHNNLGHQLKSSRSRQPIVMSEESCPEAYKLMEEGEGGNEVDEHDQVPQFKTLETTKQFFDGLSSSMNNSGHDHETSSSDIAYNSIMNGLPLVNSHDRIQKPEEPSNNFTGDNSQGGMCDYHAFINKIPIRFEYSSNLPYVVGNCTIRQPCNAMAVAQSRFYVSAQARQQQHYLSEHNLSRAPVTSATVVNSNYKLHNGYQYSRLPPQIRPKSSMLVRDPSTGYEIYERLNGNESHYSGQDYPRSRSSMLLLDPDETHQHPASASTRPRQRKMPQQLGISGADGNLQYGRFVMGHLDPFDPRQTVENSILYSGEGGLSENGLTVLPAGGRINNMTTTSTTTDLEQKPQNEDNDDEDSQLAREVERIEAESPHIPPTHAKLTGKQQVLAPDNKPHVIKIAINQPADANSSKTRRTVVTFGSPIEQEGERSSSTSEGLTMKYALI